MKFLCLILGLFSFLFYGCFDFGCLEYSSGPEPLQPKTEKTFTIINRTDKEYKNNFLAALCTQKKTASKGKMFYNSNYTNDRVDYTKRRGINVAFNKIIIIGANKKKVNKDEKGYILRINNTYCYGTENLFLLSLNGGERKIFFGAHGYDIRSETKRNAKTCSYDFVRWDVHPVWQEKELTITIEKDGKITFKDPKIKETKKVRLTKTEYVDPKNLPLVDCSKVVCGE